MSEKFNGFSQDEIKRLSSGGSSSSSNKNKQKKINAVETMKSANFRAGHGGIRRCMLTENNSDINRRLQQQHSNQQQKVSQTKSQTPSTNGSDHRNKISEKLQSINVNNESMDDINLDRSMSKSIEEALFYQPLKMKKQQQSASVKSTALAYNTEAVNIIDLQSTTEPSNDSSIIKLNNIVDSQISTATNTSEDSSILTSSSPISSSKSTGGYNVPASELEVQSPFKGISLKDFESHRKMIEEQNRQKKEMLYKAIEQHSQKTAAETRKIEEIKAELAKLDNDLAVDVALLRKQIDNACIHFTTVEKHYMKIESQFLKAKMDLHSAAEKKELLTEHLCTVIAHNEDRKAQKLTELMQKVGLATKGDYEPPTYTTN